MGTISIKETKPASVGGVPQYSNNNIMPQPGSTRSSMPGAGMQPTGTWMNQSTGDLVTVDNMVNDMSQNGAQVMLSTGELISFSEFARDYIQVDNADVESDIQENNNINTIIADTGIVTEQTEFSLDRPLNNTNTNTNTNTNNINNTNNITDYLNIQESPVHHNTNITKPKQMVIDLIENLSSSPRSRKPEVEIDSVIIKNIPREALSSLMKYFNVSVSDITDVIFEKLVDKNIIKKCITDYIDDVKTKSCRNKTTVKTDSEQIGN